MPRKKKIILRSEELDQSTKLQIFGKKLRGESHPNRIPCPTCPDRPPNGLNGEMISLTEWTHVVNSSLVDLPQRREPNALYTCSVCEEILRMESILKGEDQDLEYL